ncbi:peptide ABC transporter substrate-binding protein [Bacillus suaedaesalsae]|uniref:Peptide ABC transporter substrate-binding protein n=1 Tax=Bacillus suaedaesalsae TaxID=2810349 RepID=A0ABS2DKC5_9BACI|nr:peptide ABC transporter substrate-binding protein [Bacillus suaedaesalsae]MBM6618954.1 peptide ABC transporter substrate-binding protein [Bacillus suaedaesalsae]
MNKKGSILLALSLLLSMFLTACSGGTSNEGKKNGSDEAGEVKQVIRTIETAEIPTMDTVQGTDAVAFQVMNEVFEGLYRLDTNNQPTPGIAESHEVSEDGLVYTFKLRDAKWSNGTPVTAHDFVYAWRLVVDPNSASQYNFIMGDIKNAAKIAEGEMKVEDLGVVAQDEKTLQVTLEKPTPYFLSLTTFAVFLPQNEEFRTGQGENYALESENLIYNGPFTLEEWQHEEGWKLVKNESYWDSETVKLDEVVVKVVKDPATAVSLYETAQIDRTQGLASDYVSKYIDHEDLVTYGEPTLFFFKFNQTREALANVDIRKAISMAIDKQGFTDVILNNGSIPAYFAVPKDFVSHPDTGEDFRVKNPEFLNGDVKVAQEHWEKGLQALGESSIELELLGGDTETAMKTQEYFKNQLETNLPGLTIKLLNVPFKQRLEIDDAMNYDIQLSGWGPDYQDAMTFMDLWVTDGGHNKMGYSNAEFDKLINDAKTTLAGDQVARFEAIQEAERILLEEDAAIAPLYQRGTSLLQKQFVKNVPIHSFGPEVSYKWAYVEK